MTNSLILIGVAYLIFKDQIDAALFGVTNADPAQPNVPTGTSTSPNTPTQQTQVPGGTIRTGTTTIDGGGTPGTPVNQVPTVPSYPTHPQSPSPLPVPTYPHGPSRYELPPIEQFPTIDFPTTGNEW